MLLTGHRKEISRPECNHNFQSVNCVAHLDEDVSEALPYLNAVLGGIQYVKEPASVTFKMHGKLITVHGRMIAINALKDESEAEKIVQWVKKEINEAWEKRDEIVPSYESEQQPQMMQILKLLPRTNCGMCNEPTCMVFALRMAEGVKEPADCPPLNAEAARALEDYLAGFPSRA
jgi:ArsR family metal-binding transcriptional regulator